MARYIVIDASGAVINAVEWDGVAEWSPPEGCTLEQHDTAPITEIAQPEDTTPYFVPAYLVRQRLQAIGLWAAAAAALSANPEAMIWFATLEQGVIPDDPLALGLLAAIGADPAVIFARGP